MELESYFRFLLALVFVLGLIGGAALLARRLFVGTRFLPKSGRASRLSVEEILPLDARRRLLLIRRDQQEHLILLGPSQDLLIENIADGPRADGQNPAP